ncbi:MAG: transporter, partial [Algiphilus sp.]
MSMNALPFVSRSLALLGLFVGATGATAPDNAVTPAQTVSVPERGALSLSVEEAVALVLEHNPELASERRNPIVAGTFEAVERARFDPTLFANVTRSRALTQQQFDNTNETLEIESDRESYAVGARQVLPTGTELELSLSQQLSESNRSPTQADAELGLTVTQALLRGAGMRTNL